VPPKPLEVGEATAGEPGDHFVRLRFVPQQLLDGTDAEAPPSVGSVGVRVVHGLEEGHADGVVRTSINQLTAAWYAAVELRRDDRRDGL